METKESNWSYFLESIANTITSLSSNRKVGNGYDINVLERRQEAQNGAEHGKFVFLHGNTIAVEKAIRKVREPLNNSLCSVPTRCISRNLHLVKVISAQNSHYLSAFLLLFLKKGRLPPVSGYGEFSPGYGKRIQIGTSEHGVQSVLVFLQTTIHGFPVAELTLDDPLHLTSH